MPIPASPNLQPTEMPELPEVETVRRHLAPVLTGSVVTHVEVRHPRTARRQPRPADIPDRLVGRTITNVGRTGKFLMVDVDGDEFVWITHLGMSGRITFADTDEPEEAHTHMVVRHDAGAEVRFVDSRTFGFTAVYTHDELSASTMADLGPDALDHLPSLDHMAQVMSGRTVVVKSLLLDQRFLAGLGNIYADEVLHRARIHGTRRAGSLERREISAIRRHIRPVLEAGLAHGGTSLDDLAYLLPDGRAGEFLAELRVYGREGEPCVRCGSTIERQVLGGRSSFACPSCQV